MLRSTTLLCASIAELILIYSLITIVYFHELHIGIIVRCCAVAAVNRKVDVYEFILFTLIYSHFTLVKEALIEIGCVVTSLVVGWLSRACTVAKRCILGL